MSTAVATKAASLLRPAELAAKRATLQRLSCSIFGNVYNPTHARTGHRILRERLAGPRLTSYWPVQPPSVKELNKMLEADKIVLQDMDEILRLNKLRALKARGKGAPKKGEGKQASIKKRK